MSIKYSVNTFIDELVERDMKGKKRKKIESIKQNKRERYQRSMQRSTLQNFILEHAYTILLVIIGAISIWGVDIAQKQTIEATGRAELVVGVGGIVFFVFIFIASVGAFLASLPRFIENTVIFVKDRNYINAMGKSPQRTFRIKLLDKSIAEAESLTINPLNTYVVNENEKIAYRLYEFVDLSRSTVDHFEFTIPHHLKVESNSFEPNAEYKIVSNRMNYEAIGEFVYRSYSDIKAIEHARYKAAVKDLPTHQQDTQTANLVNDLNK